MWAVELPVFSLFYDQMNDLCGSNELAFTKKSLHYNGIETL